MHKQNNGHPEKLNELKKQMGEIYEFSLEKNECYLNAFLKWTSWKDRWYSVHPCSLRAWHSAWYQEGPWQMFDLWVVGG